MAKKNVQNSKKVVEEPIVENNGVTEPAGAETESQATPVEGTPTAENVQEELSVQQEQSGGEQTDDKGDSPLDSESEDKTVGEKGSGFDDPLMDEEPEDVYKEAKAIIKQMIDEAISESDTIDEPKETTERRNRIAFDVFAKNSQCNTLYFTADLIPFFVKSDAFRHGSLTLKNETIVTINRK